MDHDLTTPPLRPHDGPPAAALLLIRTLLPYAERDEVISDVIAEHARLCATHGRREADNWVWRQAFNSAPALMQRAWGRGFSGFESQSNYHRPGGIMLEQWIQDTRFALRRLRKRPLFAFLAILTLALGVGGTAAIYSLVRGLLLAPLPYKDQSSLVAFSSPFDWSQSEHLFLQENNPGFAGTAMYTQMNLTMRDNNGSTKPVSSVLPSNNLFEVLGVKPFLGRALLPTDMVRGAPSVVILSYSLWRELGADPKLVGNTINMGGEPQLVVGVMPRGFWFPDPSVRLWANSPFDAQNRSGNYAMIGRLPPGHDIASMAGPLQRMGAALKNRYNYSDQWDKSKILAVKPIADEFAGTVKPMLLATLAAMALILLIACSNVAALMLGQVDSRSTEFAVRTALGANRRQLLQQLVIETVVLGLSAGLVGAAIAAASYNVLTHALPLGVMLDNATLDWSLFGAAIVISLLAALIVAAAPAISLWRGDLRDALTKARTSGIGATGGTMESALVVVEVALAVLLVAGAALLIRTVTNLRNVNAGIDADRIAVVDVLTEYMTPAPERRRILADMVRNVETIPGVESAGLTQRLPLKGGGDNWGFGVEGVVQPAGGASTTAFRIVTPHYLDALGMKLVEGRNFTDADATNGDTVVIINEATRDRFFNGLDPIGRRVATGFGGSATVIGVVKNSAERDLTSGPSPARYMLSAIVPSTSLSQYVAVRVKPGVDPASVLDAVRKSVLSTSSILAVQRTTTMRAVVDEAVGPALQLMGLLVILGGLALLLGAIGVYGVVSHFVSKRRREWSIRLALGLRPMALISQIVTVGGTLVTIGAAVGLVAAMGLMRVLRTFLYDVKPADGTSLLVAMLTLVAAGMVAAFIPAFRASRVDPASVLREQ
jgi:predicted permease